MNTSGYFDDLLIERVSLNTYPYREDHIVRAYHPYLYSLELIAEGEVTLHVENKVVLLKSPVVFCTGGNDRFYFFQHTQKRTPYRHLYVDFQGERGRRINDAFFRAFPSGKTEVNEESLSNLISIYEDLDYHFNRSGECDQNSLVLKVEQLFYFILAGSGKKSLRQTDPFELNLIHQSIQQNPFNEYDLKKLASARNISVVYLRKLFRERYGIPLHRFIFIRRIKSSASLLSTGRYRMNELADMCGFSNPPAFTRAFRRTFGMSPYEFKQKYSAK